MRYKLGRACLIDPVLVLVAISLTLYYLHFSTGVVFVASSVAIIGLTYRVASATNVIAAQVSNTWAALMNATFGNAIELFIAIIALRQGLVDTVKASIIGSIIINVLLLIGLAMFCGGLKDKEQRFNKDSAGISSTMLIIVVVGLALPSLYSMVEGKSADSLSEAVSIIFGGVYVLGMVYMLVTHKHLFTVENEAWGRKQVSPSTRTAMISLLFYTVLLAFEANALVSTFKPLMASTGLSETFVGLVFVALLTNIPEHLSAIAYARRDNMTLSLEIGMNSATQIALFVVPVLVLVSHAFMATPLNLVFTPFELAAVMITAVIVNALSPDGICHWLEGAQLIATYLLIASAFYFV
ncbi:MAG: calcium/proton exchanger [Chloroflexi bacterium]|nr:calcium/proton exchanger [Chloroflexota bacterium]